MSDYDDSQLPSKSQRKRDMHALQELGRRLLEADRRTLEACRLPAELQEAIAEFHRLPNAHGARKRQIQFIGRLMRDVDAEHVREVLDRAGQHAAHAQRRFHELEQQRDALVNGDDSMIEQIIEDNPDIDIQHFRQLVRQSRRELAAGKPPAAARKLFRYLQELSETDQ